MKVLDVAKPGATFLLNSPYGPDDVWDHLPGEVQRQIIDKRLDLWVIDAFAVARDAGMGNRINTVMQPCFFRLSGVLPAEQAIAAIKAPQQNVRRARSGDRRAQLRRDRPLDAATCAELRPCRRQAPHPRSPRLRPGRRARLRRSGSPRRCWRARATCCRSAPCPSTARSRPAQRSTRSGRSPRRSRSGTRTSASTAASAPSCARTPRSG